MEHRIWYLLAYIKELDILECLHFNYDFIEQIIWDIQKRIPHLSLGYGKFFKNNWEPSIRRDLIRLSYFMHSNNIKKIKLNDQTKKILDAYSKSTFFNDLKISFS